MSLSTGQGSSNFYFDGEAWTCPNCEKTVRVPPRYSPVAADSIRRGVRDTHKCPKAVWRDPQSANQ